LNDYLAARRRGDADVAASTRGATDEEDGHEQDRSGH
jgi:hypothetical protein